MYCIIMSTGDSVDDVSLKGREDLTDPQVTGLKELLICPITYEVFKTPLLGEDRHTYEETPIKKYLLTHSESPMTRASILPHQLYLNSTIKNIIGILNSSGINKYDALYKLLSRPTNGAFIRTPVQLINRDGSLELKDKDDITENEPRRRILDITLENFIEALKDLCDLPVSSREFSESSSDKPKNLIFPVYILKSFMNHNPTYGVVLNPITYMDGSEVKEDADLYYYEVGKDENIAHILNDPDLITKSHKLGTVRNFILRASQGINGIRDDNFLLLYDPYKPDPNNPENRVLKTPKDVTPDNPYKNFLVFAIKPPEEIKPPLPKLEIHPQPPLKKTLEPAKRKSDDQQTTEPRNEQLTKAKLRDARLERFGNEFGQKAETVGGGRRRTRRRYKKTKGKRHKSKRRNHKTKRTRR